MVGENRIDVRCWGASAGLLLEWWERSRCCVSGGLVPAAQHGCNLLWKIRRIFILG